MTKRYDRAYFERWYRGTMRVNAPAEVRRKVVLAAGLAEYFLRRPLRSVLDVGCGEGAWFPHLRRLRPGVRYMGVEPSRYAVRRYGRARNIREGSFARLAALEIGEEFDLVVCSDVLHYLTEDEIRAGIPEIARLCGGIAFLEVLTREDDVIGDLDGLMQRPASFYRSTFSRAGLVAVGPYSWLAPALRDDVTALEQR